MNQTQQHIQNKTNPKQHSSVIKLVFFRQDTVLNKHEVSDKTGSTLLVGISSDCKFCKKKIPFVLVSLWLHIIFSRKQKRGNLMLIILDLVVWLLNVSVIFEKMLFKSVFDSVDICVAQPKWITVIFFNVFNWQVF